jgi:transcriptional regulator with XRE-family HTH domain
LIAAREAFGPTLRAQRERRGIALQAIADSTKISVSLLAALERNDVARWPKGIFRRAFFREYVAAIGLSPEPMMAEFVRLFPDDPCPEVSGPYSEISGANELRLTLESDPRASRVATRVRVVVALIEVSGVLLLGSIAAWVLNAHLWTTSGVIGLVYYPLANMCLERTPRLRSLYGVIGPQPFHWLRVSAGALRLLHIIWQRPAVSMRRLPQDANDETPPPAPEWRTASN